MLHQIKVAFERLNCTSDGIVSAILMLFQHNQLDEEPKYAAFVLNNMLSSDQLADKVFKNVEFQKYLQNEYKEKHIALLTQNLRSDLSNRFSNITTNLLDDNIKIFVAT